ncbi:MAG: glycosyltransferase, partial [Enterobacter sp.]|nr:glycosyltransferase [Enterobacter sp.]
MHIVHTEADGGKGGQPLRIINESLGMIQRGNAGLPVVTMPLKRKNLKNLQVLRRWMKDNRHSIDVINSHNSADTWLVALANLTLSNPVPLVRTRHASGVPRNNWTTRWLFRTACAHIVTTGEALRHQVA